MITLLYLLLIYFFIKVVIIKICVTSYTVLDLNLRIISFYFLINYIQKDLYTINEIV